MEFTYGVILALAGAGAVAGFMSGLLGIGGGLILIPILLEIISGQSLPIDMAVRLVFGTNLAVAAINTGIGSIEHRARRNIWWDIAIPLAIASIIGALVGSTVAAGLGGKVLKNSFGIIIMLTGVYLGARGIKVAKEKEAIKSLWYLIPGGLGIGFISAMLGLSGGFLLLPFLTLVLGYPAHVAVGIASITTFSISVAGAAGYIANGWHVPDLPGYSLGYVNLPMLVYIAAGSIISARIGSKVSNRIEGKWLIRIFSAVIFAAGLKMLISL